MIKDDGYSFLQMTKSHLVQSSEFELLFHNYFCLSKFIFPVKILRLLYLVCKLVCRNHHQYL